MRDDADSTPIICDAEARIADGCCAPSTSTAPLRREHGKWGLPSASCSANWTRYWTEEYPRQHRAWRAQGRVVAHCSEHTGLGNYLRSIPAALVFSMVTEQALTLLCDMPSLMQEQRGRVVDLPRLLARFFRGPHFDWAFEPQLPPSAPVVSLSATQMTPFKWPTNASHGMRVTSNLATWPRRILQFTKSMPYFARHFGSPAGSDILRRDANLDGCLLRFLLQPRAPLARAANDLLGVAPAADRLLPIAAMHVRVGDHAFAHEGWRTKSGSWYMSHDERFTPYDASPRAAFACLARLSGAVMGAVERSGAIRSGGGAPPSSADSGAPPSCVPCVVLSDSSHVEECARRALAAPLATPGSSVHFSASASALASNTTNVQRVFLDWFLLAQSGATLFTNAESTFESTAWAYKLASARVSSSAGHDELRSRSSWPHIHLNSAQLKQGKCMVSPGNPLSARTCELVGASREAVGRFWREQCRPPAPVPEAARHGQRQVQKEPGRRERGAIKPNASTVKSGHVRRDPHVSRVPARP